MTFYVAVEGQGDQSAAPNLLNRLPTHLGHLGYVSWHEPPFRLPVTSRARAEQLAELVRPRQDVTGLLVLRDDEDACPRDTGPEISSWFAGFDLPFPVATTLFYREYETLFLPCLPQLAGRPSTNGPITRPGLVNDAVFEGDPESRRDAKGVISRFLPGSQIYKETTDQLAMTRLLDLSDLDGCDLPCWGTLKRSVNFFIQNAGTAGGVYPPPPR